MTCLGRVTEGKAVMDDPGVLSDEELDEGFILTCISKPDSEEITIDFDDVQFNKISFTLPKTSSILIVLIAFSYPLIILFP